MATKQIYWGDGTSDVITVTFTGDVGSSQMTVASSPNRFVIGRTKVISLKSAGGVSLGTLIISQGPRSRSYTMAFNQSYK